jgi:hypothetical protein
LFGGQQCFRRSLGSGFGSTGVFGFYFFNLYRLGSVRSLLL